MSQLEIERWKDDVDGLEDTTIRLSRPIDVFLGEAIDAAKFHAKYWAAVRGPQGAIVRPGLELAAGGRGTKALLTADTGAEIRSLQAAARTADTNYQFAQTRPQRAPVEDGRAVLGRLTAGLRWLLDDGIEDEADVKLANLDARHDAPTSIDGLASALEAYADLAAQLRDDLAAFASFDLELLTQAKAVASALREAGPRGPSDDARAAMELRDGLFILLRRRTWIVRRAAEFVFYDHPEIVRERASAYDRRRRARNRASAEATDAPVEPAEA